MWNNMNQACAVTSENVSPDDATLPSATTLSSAMVKSDIENAWRRVATKLCFELGEDIYSSWFGRVVVEGFHNGVISLSVPTRFLKSWICSHYMERLLDLWKIETPETVDVSLSVRGPEQGDAARHRIQVENAKTVSLTNPHMTSTGGSGTVTRMEPISVGSQLDPRYTFETFSVAPENDLASTAVKGMISQQTPDGATFNILYIHGSVGLGKTHLLQATTTAAKQHRPCAKVMYLTAERFMYRFVAAIKRQDTITFKEHLRGIELLLIDDMQFLQGQSIQQEFCHTFNELIESGRQIVVAADRPPASLESLDERMRSRLSSGLVVKIESFGRDLRLDILRRKLHAAQQRTSALRVGQDVLELIADQVTGNGRELEGALNRIIAHNQFNKAPVTMAMAENAIRDLVRVTEPCKIRIEQIQRIVAKHFNISRQDIISSRRNRSIVRPRQICMYLAKTLTARSFPEIGRRFGGRDHTTVLHAVRKIETMMHDCQNFSDEVNLLRCMIED